MEEGAVANSSDGGLLPTGLGKTVGHPNARSHRDEHVHGLERRHHAHRVAADVAREDGLTLVAAQVVEEGAVRATRAERGRATGHRNRFEGRRRLGRLRQHSCEAEPLAHVGQREFAAERNDVLAMGHRDASSPDLLLDEGVEFLHDDERAHLVRKVADLLERERVAHPQFEDGLMAGKLAYVLVGDAGRDDADIRITPFGTVDATHEALGRRPGGDRLKARLHLRMAAPGHLGDDHARAPSLALIGR